jgi:hypothetical protein
MADETRMGILQRQVVYDADDYSSRDTLQTALKPELDKQQERITELESLKSRQDVIAKEMSEDLIQQKPIWDCLKEAASGDRQKFGLAVRGLLERIPVLRSKLPDRPLSELLQEKIHLTETRVREVGSFLDRMESEVENVRQDIQRLNKKMLLANQNKEKAAQYILQLKEIEKQLDNEVQAMGSEVTLAKREKQTELDEVRRLIGEHGGKLRLYANADERINSIVKMNNNFLELLNNLHNNMQNMYDSGQEVLDELRGNLASLSTATEASELTMDMQKAMQSLKSSVNKVATLASQTSLYLTQNVEKLTSEMRIYDESTQQLVEANLAAERAVQEKRLDETLKLAREQMGGQSALPGA